MAGVEFCVLFFIFKKLNEFKKALHSVKFLSNMTTKIFNIILILTSSFSFSQNSDRIYYDKDWKETTKENASFYRIKPSKKVDNLFLMEDFYSNKTPQFQGYALQSDENSYVGDIVWYDENGFDTSEYQYYNNSAVPVLTYYYPNGKKRKTIEYKKGRKNGFSIVYHQDGTVLMKGKYLNGKPVEGDFEEVKNWDDYRENKLDEEAYQEQTEVMVETSPVMVEDYQAGTKKKVITKIVKKKIFWINSKQLAQEIWYDIEYDRMHPFKQINYDVTGKVLQTINQNDFEEYGSEISNGNDYQYYTQNKFAVSIKSKTGYKQGQKFGEEIKYYPNGKIHELTKYSDGEKVGDEIVYNKDETIMKKRLYKNGEPFEGNFEENFAGRLLINQSYVKGLKEGEAIVKTDTDSIVAKGIYKNGKPYNGTFVVKTGEDLHELIHVADFKKNGLQKVFNYDINNPVKTYNAVNDIIDGETIFYDNGEVTGKLEYKNGLPYEGKLAEAEKAVIYKKGAIAEEIFYRSTYGRTDENNILKSKHYTNGKLSKIDDRSFTLTEKMQDSYEGIYKDEKPYSGYFSADLREFNYVDYYENGTKKYQYSNNYLENLEKYQYPNYDIKSTYKDGKIVDGPEYIKQGRQFISKYWKNGVLMSFDFDVFAMHYFNRNHFELKNNAIELEEFNNKVKGKIVLEKSGNRNIGKFSIDNKVLATSCLLEVSDAAPVETGSILYFETNNKIEARLFTVTEGNDDKRRDSEMFNTVFTLYIDHNKTIEENFNIIAERISSEKDVELLFGNELKGNMIAGLRLNQAKKPEIGTLILKNKNNSYDLKLFMKEKILAEKKNVDLKNVKAETKLLHEILEKKMNEDFK
jgi:antitoxin component YwqK of YwqJK toxin-antitoxin module